MFTLAVGSISCGVLFALGLICFVSLVYIGVIYSFVSLELCVSAIGNSRIPIISSIGEGLGSL